MVRGVIDLLMKTNEQQCRLEVQHSPGEAPDGKTSRSTQVDIIGAGLAGTALALALRKEGYACRVWEARSQEASQISSGVILTPNALRSLDQLGVLARIRDRCWIAAHRTYANEDDEITRRTLIADESRYGYTNHRVWRSVLLDEMRAMLSELDVPITYLAKLTSIESDSSSEVTFRINGMMQHTQLLIGADGIYSTVRRYISEIEPEYTGVIGVLTHIKSLSVHWPRREFMQCTIQASTSTPIFMIPEDRAATEVMVGMQVQLPTFTRTDWERLSKDQDRMAELYRRDYDTRRGVARQIIDAVCARKEELFLWPFMRMPPLERWYSETGNVILVGDAAHALPPSSGQGVNQALEDVYALTSTLATGRPRLEALRFWQEKRQERVGAVYDWATNVQNVQRMSSAEREAHGNANRDLKGDTVEDMSWLYNWDIDKQVEDWAKDTA